MIEVPAQSLLTIKAILKKYFPECEVRVFGSRITGKAKKYSDLDLAIIGKGRLARDRFYQMKEDFENSDLPFRVDVLDWHALSDEFQRVIEKQYEVL